MNVFALSSAWASAQLLAPTRRISGKDLVATKKPAKEEEDGFESLFMIGSLLDAAREVRASDVDDLLVHLSTCPNMVRDASEPKARRELEPTSRRRGQSAESGSRKMRRIEIHKETHHESRRFLEALDLAIPSC